MFNFYELLTVVAIDFLLLFDDNATPKPQHLLDYGTNPTVFSLFRSSTGKGLNPYLGKHAIPLRLDEVKKRGWAKVSSSQMRKSDASKHILGHDYDRYDVMKSMKDFTINDDFFDELMLSVYRRLDPNILSFDKTHNPLIKNKTLQGLVLNIAYFMFVSQMEYNSMTMEKFVDNRALINSPQWFATIKLSGFSKKGFEDAIKQQLRSSQAITKSLNRMLNARKKAGSKRTSNSFLANGPGATFPTNVTLIYLIDLNNNTYRYIDKFAKSVDNLLPSVLIPNASIENTHIFRSRSNTIIEKKIARRFKTYMYILTEARDQFDAICMSGGAWLMDPQSAYLALWRFSNIRMSKDIFKSLNYKDIKFD